MSSLVVGIDFGNTKTSAYVYQNHCIEAILTPESDEITPSYVYMNNHNNLTVNKFAITTFADSKPERLVHDIKRFIGRTFEEVEEANCLKNYTFELKNTSNKSLVIADENNVINIPPEEFLVPIFKKIKRDIQNNLTKHSYRVILTVPATFYLKQRDIISAAAERVGFKVFKLISEAVAAGITYMHENAFYIPRHLLVFDLGGGSFDVAVIFEQQNKDNKVIGVDGDINLGGRDFDNLIMNYVCDQLKQIYKIDIRSNSKQTRRLLAKCEEAKEALSFVEKTSIYVEQNFDCDEDFEIPLTRAQFEDMCIQLFERTIEITDRCLKSVMLPKSVIDDVVIVGGSTRIPKIQEMLLKYINGTTLRTCQNSRGCTAIGAALEGAMLSSKTYTDICNLYTTDVVPISIGIYDCFNGMTLLVKKNTSIPWKRSLEFITINDKQNRIIFRLHEGESNNVRKYKCRRSYTITGLTPSSPGNNKIITTFIINSLGKLTVTAAEELEGIRNDLVVIEHNRSKKSGSGYWKNRFTLVNTEVCTETENYDETAKSKAYLWDYCSEMITNVKSKKLPDTNLRILDRCVEIMTELKANDKINRKRLDMLREEITFECNQLMKELNFSISTDYCKAP